MMFQLKQLFAFILMIKLTITVNNFPQILTKTYNQTLNLSSNAILTCHVRNLGEHHVTWFKYDSLTASSYPLAVGETLFTPDKRYSISSYPTSSAKDDSYWTLEIYQLNFSDEATYQCKISNRRTSVSISIHLHIQTPMILFPSYLYVEPGTNIKFNCSILIDNNYNRTLLSLIEWHFVSKQLNQTKPNNVHIGKTLINNRLISYLIINNVQTYHSGIWTCVFSRQRRTAKLIVEKDVLHRQRVSALLSNNSNGQYIRHVFFILLILIHFV